jgi:hypothetical protein
VLRAAAPVGVGPHVHTRRRNRQAVPVGVPGPPVIHPHRTCPSGLLLTQPPRRPPRDAIHLSAAASEPGALASVPDPASDAWAPNLSRPHMSCVFNACSSTRPRFFYHRGDEGAVRAGGDDRWLPSTRRRNGAAPSNRRGDFSPHAAHASTH